MRSALAIALTLVAFCVLGFAVSAATASPGITNVVVPKTVHTVSPPTTAPSRAISVPPYEPPISDPVRIEIPVIDVNAPVISVGEVDGSVGTPPLTNHNLAGWYDKTVTPGQIGPSLIDGHIDGYGVASVFYRLPALKAGDVIRVLEKDGKTITFKVTWVQVVAKTAFPWKSVLDWTTSSTLRLVTCGGPFNSLTGHYVDNVIVYANELPAS